MNSNSSSPSSKDVSLWSEHALQITTPQDKYLGNNGTSTDERLGHVGPPLSRAYHSSSMVSSPSGDIYIFGGVNSRVMNDTWAIRISGDSHLPLGPGRNPGHMGLTASLVETTGETPSPRYGHQSAMANGLLIVWGGYTTIVDGKAGPADGKSIYALNITTCHWTKLDIQPAPSARVQHSACVCGNKFIVFGGELEAEGCLNDLWGLDLDSLTQGTPKWERITIAPGSESPSKRVSHTMVAYREKLYLFGGWGNETRYNDTWCFDMTTRVWAELKCTGPIPPPRSGHAVALVGDAMYVFGGLGGGVKNLGDTWIFKIHEQRWYRFPSMDSEPSARYGHILATMTGCVLLVGGVWGNLDKHVYFDRVHILDADRIDYPEKGEEITVKSTSSIEQSATLDLLFRLFSRFSSFFLIIPPEYWLLGYLFTHLTMAPLPQGRKVSSTGNITRKTSPPTLSTATTSTPTPQSTTTAQTVTFEPKNARTHLELQGVLDKDAKLNFDIITVALLKTADDTQLSEESLRSRVRALAYVGQQYTTEFIAQQTVGLVADQVLQAQKLGRERAVQETEERQKLLA